MSSTFDASDSSGEAADGSSFRDKCQREADYLRDLLRRIDAADDRLRQSRAWAQVQLHWLETQRLARPPLRLVPAFTPENDCRARQLAKGTGAANQGDRT